MNFMTMHPIDVETQYKTHQVMEKKLYYQIRRLAELLFIQDEVLQEDVDYLKTEAFMRDILFHEGVLNTGGYCGFWEQEDKFRSIQGKKSRTYYSDDDDDDGGDSGDTDDESEDLQRMLSKREKNRIKQWWKLVEEQMATKRSDEARIRKEFEVRKTSKYEGNHLRNILKESKTFQATLEGIRNIQIEDEQPEQKKRKLNSHKKDGAGGGGKMNSKTSELPPGHLFAPLRSTLPPHHLRSRYTPSQPFSSATTSNDHSSKAPAPQPPRTQPQVRKTSAAKLYSSELKGYLRNIVNRFNVASVTRNCSLGVKLQIPFVEEFECASRAAEECSPSPPAVALSEQSSKKQSSKTTTRISSVTDQQDSNAWTSVAHDHSSIIKTASSKPKQVAFEEQSAPHQNSSKASGKGKQKVHNPKQSDQLKTPPQTSISPEKQRALFQELIKSNDPNTLNGDSHQSTSAWPTQQPCHSKAPQHSSLNKKPKNTLADIPTEYILRAANITPEEMEISRQLELQYQHCGRKGGEMKSEQSKQPIDIYQPGPSGYKPPGKSTSPERLTTTIEPVRDEKAPKRKRTTTIESSKKTNKPIKMPTKLKVSLIKDLSEIVNTKAKESEETPKTKSVNKDNNKKKTKNTNPSKTHNKENLVPDVHFVPNNEDGHKVNEAFAKNPFAGIGKLPDGSFFQRREEKVFRLYEQRYKEIKRKYIDKPETLMGLMIGTKKPTVLRAPPSSGRAALLTGRRPLGPSGSWPSSSCSSFLGGSTSTTTANSGSTSSSSCSDNSVNSKQLVSGSASNQSMQTSIGSGKRRRGKQAPFSSKRRKPQPPAPGTLLSNSTVSFDNALPVDVYLLIRHGCSLKIGNKLQILKPNIQTMLTKAFTSSRNSVTFVEPEIGRGKTQREVRALKLLVAPSWVYEKFRELRPLHKDAPPPPIPVPEARRTW